MTYKDPDPAQWAPVAVVYRLPNGKTYHLHNGAWLGYSTNPKGVKIAHVRSWANPAAKPTRETLYFCYAGVHSAKCAGRFIALKTITVQHGPAIVFKSSSYDHGMPHNVAFISWNGSRTFPSGGISQKKGTLVFEHYVPRSSQDRNRFHEVRDEVFNATVSFYKLMQLKAGPGAPVCSADRTPGSPRHRGRAEASR